MEKNWLNNVLSNLCTTRADIFGEKSAYLEFESDESNKNESPLDGCNSNRFYGKIIYKDKHGNVRESESIIIKRALKIWDKKITTSFSFINEMNFYTKVAPALSTLDVAFSSLVPKFYHGEVIFNAECDQSTIILENLKSRGYTMAEKKSFLSHQHLKLMMRKLGQFHAYSYKAKKSIPNLFYPLANNSLDSNRELNKESFGILAIVAQRGLECLQQDATYMKYIPRLREILDNSHDVFVRILTGDRSNPISTIVHGDYLRNNVMFKYDENGIPNDLIMVDMATFRYGSPVIDLAIVLYMNADQDTRNMYWDSLIDEYYTALKETFVESEIPSKTEILAEFIDKSIYGYLIAADFLAYLMADDDDDSPLVDVLDMHPENMTVESVIEREFTIGGKPATEAMGNILKDMIDRGFICK
ncbi:uncharacterized protein LOC135847020 [Planococcus citri]|uniref:uncharacterized protein LOC135847020 n=1 Tax=Planococcus citri TaxID=170843 RepID=UPI0031F8EDF7